MTEEDRYCVEILKQSYAVRRALEKIESLILEGHLNGCVLEGIEGGRSVEVIRELVELFEQAGR